jgi:hypothetical protein
LIAATPEHWSVVQLEVENDGKDIGEEDLTFEIISPEDHPEGITLSDETIELVHQIYELCANHSGSGGGIFRKLDCVTKEQPNGNWKTHVELDFK